jgi:flagellar basal body-associated protein FliL
MEESQKSKSLSKKDWIIVLVLFLAIIAVLIVQFLNKEKAEENQNENPKSINQPESSVSQSKLLYEFNTKC